MSGALTIVYVAGTCWHTGLREELELAQAILAQCGKASPSNARAMLISVLEQVCMMKRIKTAEFLLSVMPPDYDISTALEQAVRFFPVEVVATMSKRGARITDDAIRLATLVGLLLHHV
jgi:hypothetical protein